MPVDALRERRDRSRSRSRNRRRTVRRPRGRSRWHRARETSAAHELSRVFEFERGVFNAVDPRLTRGDVERADAMDGVAGDDEELSRVRAGGVAHDDVGDGEVDGGARADLGGSAVEDEDARGGGDEPALLPTAEVVDPDVDVALRGRGVVGVGVGAQPAGVEAAVAALAPGGRDAVVVHVRAGNAGRGQGSVVGKEGAPLRLPRGRGSAWPAVPRILRPIRLTCVPARRKPEVTCATAEPPPGGVQPIRGVRAGRGGRHRDTTRRTPRRENGDTT